MTTMIENEFTSLLCAHNVLRRGVLPPLRHQVDFGSNWVWGKQDALICFQAMRKSSSAEFVE